MARKVEFQGTVHEFPDSATDDQVRAALTGGGQQQAPAEQPGVASRVASNWWDEVNPVTQFKGLVGALSHPVDSLKHMGEAQDSLRLKAMDALKNGDYPGAASHALHYLIPVIGPALDKRGEQAASGDIAGSVGGTLGIATNLMAPELLKGAKLPITPKIANANPVEGAALNYLESKGVPPNAAARTGNGFVKNAQKAVDSTPLGAMVARKAEGETTKALQAEAGNLANRAAPAPVVPEQAGAGIRGALGSKVAARAADASKAYDDFRLAEQNTPMPVDVSKIKAELKPIYDDMAKWMEPAKRNASAGFTAIKSIIEGPDTLPASQAEAGLGGLKQLAREGAGRNAGLAKLVTPKLQSAIDGAVSAADPRAATMLQAGRSATAAQYGTQAILDDLRTEPVQAFRQMTYAKDAGVDLLRKVAAEAPGEMKKVGRAWLEDAFGKAQESGGFGHASKLYSDWQALGPETKKTLFNPLLVNDLDKFFLGAKKLAENPNPSGSGVLTISGGSGMLIFTNPQTGIPLALGAGALSKMMHSTAGVRALTNGIKMPLKSVGGAAAAAQILKMAGDDLQPVTLPKVAQSSPSEQSGLSASAQVMR